MNIEMLCSRRIGKNKHSLGLGHLVQQVLGHRPLLHLSGDAVGGVVALHVAEISLAGRHTHHPLLPVHDTANRGKSLVGFIL